MFDCFDKPVYADAESMFLYPRDVTGLYEKDNIIYKYAYPDTDYPILRLPFDIYDEQGDVLHHGMYMIALDSSRQYLMFLQSNILKARVPVAGYSDKMTTDEDFKKREDLANKYQKYMVKGRQKKAKEFLHELEIYDKRVRTKMSASIDISQEGVYVLLYETAFQKAFAIIPRY